MEGLEIVMNAELLIQITAGGQTIRLTIQDAQLLRDWLLKEPSITAQQVNVAVPRPRS